MPETAIDLQRVPIKQQKSREYPGPLVHLLVWTLIGFLAYGRHVLQLIDHGSQQFSWAEHLMWMSCFMPAAIFGSLIFKYERKFPLAARDWPKNVAVLAAIGALFAYIACAIASGICIAVAYFFHLPATFEKSLWRVESGEFVIQFLLYWTVVVASCVFRHFVQLQRGEREKTELLLEKSRLLASLKQAELEALRMRLNPHFLFNTLQNISVLTQQDPRTASQMLSRLGDLLRTAIRSSSEQETDLGTEIRLTESYSAMEKMRFAERLNILFEIPPETVPAKVPTLLLQPLVENAIKHGLRGMSRKGLIIVRASRENDQLILTVTDNGIGLSEDYPANRKIGIGLGGTMQRLERLYPGVNSLILSPAPDGGTQVRIALPFRPTLAEVERHDHAALAHR